MLLLAYIAPVNLSLSSLNSPLWTHFYNDALAFLALLLLLLALLVIQKKLRIPSLAFPFFLVALIPILQFYCGEIVFYLGDAALSFIYLIAFSLVVVCGYNFRLIYGQQLVLINFSKIFLCVGLFSFFIALYQFFNLSYASDFVFTSKAISKVIGNTRQPNHFSTLLLLSLLSTWYLYEKKYLSLVTFVVLVACFLLSIVLAQSRTSILVFFFLITFFYFFQRKVKCRLPFVAVFYLVFGYIFFDVATDWLRGALFFENGIYNEKNVYNFSDKWRYVIWYESFMAIVEGPLWGYGWNQSVLAPVTVDGVFPKALRFSEAHNLFFDLYLWVGPIIGSFLSLLILVIIYKAVMLCVSQEQWFILALLGAMFIHAMLEYPLYYAYFLLPFGFLTGLLRLRSNVGYALSGIPFPPLLLTIIILVASFLLSTVLKEYRRLDPGDYIVRTDFSNLSDVTLLTQLKNYELLGSVTVNDQMTGEEILWLKKLAYRYPLPQTLGMYGKALMLNGFVDEADKVFYIAKRLMPDESISDIQSMIYNKDR